MSVGRFANEPVLELRRASIRAQLDDALARLDRQLPIDVPVLIGEHRRVAQELVSTDPGDPERAVAQAGATEPGEIRNALDAAAEGLRAWRQAPLPRRAQALVAAAAWMRERRMELAALEVRECAKPWVEADADVCEAIDYLEYYALAASSLAGGEELLQLPGERNELLYEPRGVTVVIAPWNFPIAIPCGMASAALVTGNAVVLKPAEQSPGCGLRVVQALRAGGVPAAAISLLPGDGAVGAGLVRDPGVHTIAFTGSQPVGLEIVRSAATLAPGQRQIKQVIAELGGKNCVIVDADADLDEAVPGIISSAFSYAGQKCSAASRVMVHEAVADRLLERIAGAVSVLAVGQAAHLGVDVPPLIERSAKERVDRYAELAASHGRIAARREPVPNHGWFCPPTVASDLQRDSAVLSEEVFGPLLTVERVSSVEEACELVDALPFGLTGGLFARDPATVRYVQQRSPVGNLYVNRGITGAKVGRQPFGGNRLSGNGTKAGGPGYLRHFVAPRVISENTVRHGLVI